jgi:hypothetical protein
LGHFNLRLVSFANGFFNRALEFLRGVISGLVSISHLAIGAIQLLSLEERNGFFSGIGSFSKLCSFISLNLRDLLRLPKAGFELTRDPLGF